MDKKNIMLKASNQLFAYKKQIEIKYKDMTLCNDVPKNRDQYISKSGIVCAQSSTLSWRFDNTFPQTSRLYVPTNGIKTVRSAITLNLYILDKTNRLVAMNSLLKIFPWFHFYSMR